MDPYVVLGVGRDATTDEIRRRYLALARQLHPDKATDAGGARSTGKGSGHDGDGDGDEDMDGSAAQAATAAMGPASAAPAATPAEQEEERAGFQQLRLSGRDWLHSGGGAADFQQLQAAWEVLRDGTRRQALDEQRGLELARAEAHLQEVDLDDMEFQEGNGGDEVEAGEGGEGAAVEPASGGWYSWGCRCGDHIVVEEAQLEADFDVFECPSCALKIRVLFELAEEGGGGSATEDGAEAEARAGDDDDAASTGR